MEQQAQAGHRAVTVWIESGAEVAYELERLLFDGNCRVHAIEAAPHIPAVARALNDAGVIALVYGSTDPVLREQMLRAIDAYRFFRIEAGEAAAACWHLLAAEGVISRMPRTN